LCVRRCRRASFIPRTVFNDYRLSGYFIITVDDLAVVLDCYFFPAPRHIGLPFNGMANADSDPVTLNGQMTLIPRATLSPSLARQFAEQILGQLLGASKTAQLSCLASVLRANGHHAINEFE